MQAKRKTFDAKANTTKERNEERAASFTFSFVSFLILHGGKQKSGTEWGQKQKKGPRKNQVAKCGRTKDERWM